MSKQTNKPKKQTKKQQPLFSLYGARLSKSKDYVNLSVVTGEVDEDGVDSRKWATVLVKKKSKYFGVKVKEDAVVITIPRLDVEDEEEDDEDEDDKDAPLSDHHLVPVDKKDLPFDAD